MFSIGELSRRTGVKVPTIRYYEQMGLIAADGRTTGNQRRFSQDGLERLSFIRHARDLGLPLESIRVLIEMDPQNHIESHRIAAAHLADIRDRIARLQRLETELVRISESCDGGEDCSVLTAFGDHEQCSGGH
ncbi:helix-turn-helix domain-containing protein [Aliiroseovarius sp. KMU-50]|uniref:Helix-turn-helix domain-containing protein n=1 Tax=Aliiroseovarius salicola TaxID=3009082 RepID=A0ABT4VZ74_9RHOB|nr:helix-turn-helix domain-containing protein [Aliiroseovarius sp. KMU-50]MDA5093562.1 helix-turn-helix domain-containing protein [Aliiroseovarius sp. KMU-50]